MNGQKLELEPDPDLAFATGYVLRGAAKCRGRALQSPCTAAVLPRLKRLNISKSTCAFTLSPMLKRLAEAHIHVYEWRRCVDVSRILRSLTSKVQPLSVEQPISVEVRSAVQVPAYSGIRFELGRSPKLHLPWQLHNAVRQESVIQRQVGWAFVDSRAVIESSGLWYGVSVAVDEGAVRVGLCPVLASVTSGTLPTKLSDRPAIARKFTP